MRLKIYWKYFKYVMEHKKNVFLECWFDGGVSLHAFTHDLSKFSPKEFFAYANWFHSRCGVKYKLGQNLCEYDDSTHIDLKRDFEKAWQHHKDHNKHHWNYWNERQCDMPNRYVNQMIIDWKAMGRKFGDTAQEFYLKNFDNIKLTSGVRLSVEHKLGLYFHRCCECDSVYWMNCKEIIKDTIDHKEKYPERHCGKLTLEWINIIKDKYNVDMLEIFGYDENDIR